MEPLKELHILRAELSSAATHPPVAPWPALSETGVSRSDLVSVLHLLAENIQQPFLMSSVKSESGAQELSAGGLAVAWKAETSAEGEGAEPTPAGCYATTSLSHDKRILAVGSLVRALIVLDSQSPPSPVTIPAEGATAGAPMKAGLSHLSPSTISTNQLRLGGELYKSPDHYLSAMKAQLFGATDEEKAAIVGAETPALSRELARKLPNFVETTWDAKKFDYVFAAALALTRAHRPAFYQLLGTGIAPLTFADTARPTWAKALQEVRLYLQAHDFGAVLLSQPATFLVKTMRLGGMPGIKAPGVRLQQLCNDCLNRSNMGSFQRLLYALNNGRNLAPVVNRSGVVLLIADLLYKEATDPELVSVCLSIIAALARELGTIDKEVNGFLLDYYLDHRETWAALSAVELPSYNDDLGAKALDNVIGKGKFNKDDLYIKCHSATILSKMAANSGKGKHIVSNIAQHHIPFFLTVLESTKLKCSMDGWNDMQEELGLAVVKILTLVASYLHKSHANEATIGWVRSLIPFLSPHFNEEIQAYVALVLEQTKEVLTSAEVDAILKNVDTYFLKQLHSPPDRAEPLCDLLSALAPTEPKAVEILNELGLHHFGSWALPVLAALRNAMTAKSGFATVPGFADSAAQILRQALDNSDETAVGNLCETASIMCQSLPDGRTALLNAGILSPFLQWVGEVELDVVQVEILKICQTLTAELVISEDNIHLLELVVELLSNSPNPSMESILLQLLQNFASAGTPKAIFDKELNLQALLKATSKDNHKKVNRLLHQLGVKTDAPVEKSKPEKQAPEATARHGAKRGEVDRYAYVEGSQNPFQLLVAKRPSESAKAKAAAQAHAQAQAVKQGKKTQQEQAKPEKNKEKDLKGFVLIAAAKSKVKTPAAAAGKERDAGAAKNNTGFVSYKSRQADTYDNQRQKRGRQYDRDYDDDADVVVPQPKSAAAAAAKKPEPKEFTKVEEGKITRVTAGASITTYVPKAQEAPTAPKQRVVKARSDRGGVDLSRVRNELEAHSRQDPTPKKPQTWAALAKSAKDKEEREARARVEAAEAERLALEEASRLEAMKRKAPVAIDPVAELFKKLLPNSASVKTTYASEKDVRDIEEDRRMYAERKARQEAADRAKRQAEEERARLEEQRKEAERQRLIREEKERLEHEAKIRRDLEAAELAAAAAISLPRHQPAQVAVNPWDRQPQQPNNFEQMRVGPAAAQLPQPRRSEPNWGIPPTSSQPILPLGGAAPIRPTTHVDAAAPQWTASGVPGMNPMLPGMMTNYPRPNQPLNPQQMWTQQSQQANLQQMQWAQQHMQFRAQQAQGVPMPGAGVPIAPSAAAAHAQRPVTQPFAQQQQPPNPNDYYSRSQQPNYSLNANAGAFNRRL